jgi:formylglycine-generating enzyme required for sulfatase activity
VEFYLKLKGEQVGPYRLEEVQGWLNAGYVKPDDSAWFEGCADWIKVEDLPGIDLNAAGHFVRTDEALPFEAYAGEEPYIFVCYAHRDSPTVFKQIKDLHADGYRIWYDEGIGVSSEWPEEIARAVLGCSVFLVYVSPEATASVNCRNEINLALDENKPFIAVHLEESTLPPGLRLRMGDLQAVFRYKLTKDQYARKVQRAIDHFLEHGNQALETNSRIQGQSSSSQRPSRNSLKTGLGIAIGSLLLLALILKFFVFQDERASEEKTSMQVLSMGTERTVSSIGLEMIWCPPGSYQMGSPSNEAGRKENETFHKVSLSKGFYLGKYEVSQGQWEKVMGENPSFFKGEDRPVERISWDQAKSFCEKITQLDRRKGLLPEGWRYDLPTESEWEYACRAGTRTAYAWGSSIESSQANFQAEVNATREVGSYLSNPWGFFDMHGNVLEWVADRNGEYSNSPVLDPKGPPKGSNRVIRGGSWYNEGTQLRSAERASAFPGVAATFIGFRLAFKEDNLDLIPPTLEPRGQKSMVHEAGRPWLDPWMIALDNRDGNLSSQVSVKGEVEIDSLGTYELIYFVSDYSGNEANQTRSVQVVDRTPPELLLLGDTNLTVELGSPWVEPGFSANDALDGNLSHEVSVQGRVDTSKTGSYRVLYQISDGQGNQAQAERIVRVIRPVEPIAVEDDRGADKPSAKESFSASEELLKAVKNWTQVPSTVFPLGGVEVFQDFTVRIRDSKGQELASNRILAGNMVVVLSVQGTTLVVSDSETSKMRGRIEMHATNFKRKVAELFEYRKKQREEYLHLQIKPSEESPDALPDESTGELPHSETSPSTSPD